MKSTLPTDSLKLTVDTTELSPTQVRVLKQLHTMMMQVLTAEDEAEYFECSAQMLKQAVQLVKHSSFPAQQRDGIPYGEQAIEYAVETLNEALSNNGHINLDN